MSQKHYHHHFLTPAIWRSWIRINDLHFLGPLSSPLLPSMSVQLILCLHSYCLSIVVLVCFCLFFLRILHCVEFGQLSFFLRVQTIGVFAGRLCRADLFGYTQCLFNVIVSYFM